MRRKVMIVMMLSAVDGSRSLGGVDTVCQSQLQGLMEFGGEHEYLILAFNPTNKTPARMHTCRVSENINILWYNYARSSRQLKVPNVLANEILVKRHISSYRPDIVHSHLPSWHITKYGREKKVLTLHQYGDVAREPVSYFNDLLHKRLIEPYSIRVSDVVTSVSKDIMQLLQSRRHPPVDYVPNPISTAIPNFDPSCRREAVNGSPVRLLLLGVVSRRKRVLDALATISRLKSKYPDMTLVVAGRSGDDGRYQEELRDFIAAHGIEKNVEFAGSLSRVELSTELARTHLAVFFSGSETFGLAPLECIAAGVPLITTNVGVFNWHQSDFEQRGVDIISVGDVQGAAEAIARRVRQNDFFVDRDLQGYLEENFSLKSNLKKYVQIYDSV